MDDANLPSLLSLPYLGALPRNDPVYKVTREWVLSSQNPYFFAGSAARGIGSPHTAPGAIWPLAVIMQGMTSTDEEEIATCLEWLVLGGEASGLMHETFDKDDVRKITRPWFAWANSLFGEFVLALVESHPHLVLKPYTASQLASSRL